MKKLSLALVLLVVALGTVFAAEPSISGSFSNRFWFEGDGLSKTVAGIGDLKLKAEIPVGDYVNFVMDMEDGGNDENSFQFSSVYATTDVSGALGIDGLGLTLTVGSFEKYMSGWNKGSIGGNNKVDPQKTAVVVGTGADGAVLVPITRRAAYSKLGATPDISLDIGIMDALTLLTYASFDETSGDGNADFQYKVGLKLGDVVDGLALTVSYSGNSTDDVSYVKADASYEISLGDAVSITIPANLMYVLKETDKDYMTNSTIGHADYGKGAFIWQSGVKFSGMGITANAIVDSEKNSSSPGSLAVKLAYSTGDFSIYAKPGMNLNGDKDLLKAVEAGISYGVAETKLYLGYVFDIGDKEKVEMESGGDIIGGGLYFATKLSF